jgi:hypothetical protein
MVNSSLFQRKRIRNGIFAIAALCLLALGGLRQADVDPSILRIAAISAGLLVIALFMTYRAMASVLDAGLAAERDTNPMEPTHDASSGALPPRPE